MIGDTTIVGEGRTPRAKPGPKLGRGEQVGRYVVIDELGRGGMGVVYSAFDPQLDRKVALKVLHGHGSEDALASSDGQPRLLREAQALAKLSHPNVVGVHDVGTLGDAVFIAMEFVDGITLSDWAETPRAWPEIVRVLIEAGRGLAAAHEVGIIHRDFKPDNVMLDREGRPRVLDFGLARAASDGSGVVAIPREPVEQLELGSSSSFSAKLTETGALMGTPAYMAPEQFAGGRVDARTDQFSFCVSAYEALYGERPFGGESMAALSFQVHQGLVREPPKDTRVPSWLRKLLLRGLASEPEDRWPGMNALLEAMSHDPARRRRWMLGALAAAVALAGLGVVVQRSLAARPQLCTDAAAHLVGVWDADARVAVDAAFMASERSYARDTARTVVGALDADAAAWTQMHTQACAATRLRGEQSDEVLGLRMACLSRHRDALAALVQVYREADGEIVDQALDAIDSLPPLSYCADIESLMSGVSPPAEAIRAQVELMRRRLDAARSLDLAGKRSLAREQLAALREDITALDYRPLIAEFSLLYGPMLESPSARVQQLEQAVWMAEASRHDRVAAGAWVELIDAYGAFANDFDAAERAAARADAAIVRIGEDEQLRVALTVARGLLLSSQNHYEQALVLLREARAARVRLDQAYSPAALEELVLLCNAEMSLGHAERVGPVLRQAITEAEARYSAGHPRVAHLHGTLGRVHFMAGDYEAAEAELVFALDVYEATYGPSNAVAGVLNGLALVRSAAGRPADALAAWERGLAVAIELTGPTNLSVAKILGNIASAELSLGHSADALAHFERVLDILVEIFGERHINVALAHGDVGTALVATGQPERAESEYRAAIAGIEELEGPSSLQLVRPLLWLAELEQSRGREAEAHAGLERAWTIAESDPEHEVVKRSAHGALAFALARSLDARGERARALALGEQALQVYQADAHNYAKPIAELDAWFAARRK